MRNILFVGKGLITTSLAERLSSAGWKVDYYSRTETRLNSINLSKYDYVVSCLPNAEISTHVWSNILAVALASHVLQTVFIELSTLTCEAIKQIGNSFNDERLNFIEAPFTGSKTGSLKGSLIYFAYSQSVDTQHDPFLNTTSSKVYTFEHISAATQFKLFYNLWGLTALGLLGQMLRLLEALPQNELAATIITSHDDFWMSSIAQQKLNQSLARNHRDIHCKLKYAKKDIKYALDEFSDYKLDLSHCLLSILESDQSIGYDELDFTAMSELFK
ncbi:NAD(P)-binding domain-containing protein [Pseudomonas orientalis]|uniref:NAD(P)-binding domain-containing protein n=1 Tax=Pseudomonas orientalis TaxID=76758 RepID=UPI0039857B78